FEFAGAGDAGHAGCAGTVSVNRVDSAIRTDPGGPGRGAENRGHVCAGATHGGSADTTEPIAGAILGCDGPDVCAGRKWKGKGSSGSDSGDAAGEAGGAEYGGIAISCTEQRGGRAGDSGDNRNLRQGAAPVVFLPERGASGDRADEFVLDPGEPDYFCADRSAVGTAERTGAEIDFDARIDVAASFAGIARCVWTSVDCDRSIARTGG